jgi:dinuclear metal center YbgI/SA1388 family protein
MTRICDIDGYISSVAKKEYSESWDNDGVMLCEDTEKTVRKAAVCLEINEKIISLAIDGGYDLIITHHPFIFRALKGICAADYRMISKLIKNSVSVLSYHTRFDAAHGGINDALAKALCLSDIKPFGDGDAPMGRFGVLENEMTPRQFGKYIKEKLFCQSMRCAFPDENKKIKTVAVLGGGGKDFLLEASKIADAFVTGDLSHNAFIDAVENDLCVYEAGHYHTENIGARAMKELLEKEFSDIEIDFLDSENTFVVI